MVWRVGLDRTCLDRRDIRDVKAQSFCNSNTNNQSFILTIARRRSMRSWFCRGHEWRVFALAARRLGER
jgi:hypothetical protein